GGPLPLSALRMPCADGYRGAFVVHWSDHGTGDPADDRLWAINSLDLDSYVWGVAEAPNDLPPEAAKAMAITERTFAWDKVEGSRFQIDGFDISSSSSFLPPGYPGGTQLYLGYDAEAADVVAGVQDTEGHIRTYGNEGAILAT